LFGQLASYFTMALQEREVAMSRRPDEVNTSYSGKAACHAMVQAREYRRPPSSKRCKKMQKSNLDGAILEPVVEIVHDQ
jgi:hypothetical protein